MICLTDVFQELGYNQYVNRLKFWVENSREIYVNKRKFLHLIVRDQLSTKQISVDFELGEIKHFYDNFNQKIGYGRAHFRGRGYQATLYLFVQCANEYVGELIITDPTRDTMPC